MAIAWILFGALIGVSAAHRRGFGTASGVIGGMMLLTAGAAQTEVYKCTGPDGGVKYQKSPCPGAAEAKPLAIKKRSAMAEMRARHEETARELAALSAEIEQGKKDEAKRKALAENARELEHQLRQYEFNQRQEALQQEIDAIDQRIECRKATRISPHDECWELRKRGEI